MSKEEKVIKGRGLNFNRNGVDRSVFLGKTDNGDMVVEFGIQDGIDEPRSKHMVKDDWIYTGMRMSQSAFEAVLSLYAEIQEEEMSFILEKEPLNIMEALDEVNEKRSIEVYGEHLEDLELSQWSNAVAAEAGELAGICHKIDMASYPHTRETHLEEVGREAADIVTFLHLLCMREGIDLSQAIKSKFNEVSEKKGSDILIK